MNRRRAFLSAAALLFALPAAATQRIVALSPHLAELVCAVGACDKLVGVVAFSDYPEQVKQLPKVGDAFAVNEEQVLALKPDLVLAWDGGTPREVQERLAGLRLKVASIRVRRLEEVSEALLRVGSLAGAGAPAMTAARAYDARLAALRRKYTHVKMLRVLYQIEANPGYSVNRDSPISQVMALCGGENIFADLPTLAGVINREAAVARNPQVIIYSRQDDGAAIRELWARSPPVAATRAGTLYAVDGNLLDRATPRLLDGAEQLCEVLSDARAKLRATAPPRRDAGVPGSAPPRTGSPRGD